MRVDVLVVGGGAAGMAAAAKLRSLGVDKVLLVDRGDRLGGILPQCIHTGFGVRYLRRDLTGPEFAEALAKRVADSGAEVLLESHVVELEYRDVYDKRAWIASPRGYLEVSAKAVIVATGARERTIFEIGVVGDRPPAGVYTAGMAQALMDLYGVLPGRRAVVVGSGDVGLIVARRLVMQGVEVVAVVEIAGWPGGLTRNVVQCLEDWGIPLLLNRAVTEIRGGSRVEKVVVAQVDEGMRPVPGTEEEIPCDTVVVAAGLRPETGLLEKLGVPMDPRSGGPVVNEVFETAIPGVFAAGNAAVINDSVDTAAEQGEIAAEGAASFISGARAARGRTRISPGRGVRLVVPQVIEGVGERAYLYARPSRPLRRAVVRIRGLGLELRLPRAMPAEMLRIVLPVSDALGREEVAVEVGGVGEA